MCSRWTESKASDNVKDGRWRDQVQQQRETYLCMASDHGWLRLGVGRLVGGRHGEGMSVEV